MSMSRNILLILIVVLAVCAVGASYLYHRERQSGVEIEINEHGVTINGN
jgi:cell division protein FtsL